jgi:hypothetical protein
MGVKPLNYTFSIVLLILLAGALGKQARAQDFETTTTQALLVGKETRWKNLKLTVARIEQSQPDTELNKSVTLFLQIGKDYYERTLKAFQFDSVGNYEIYTKEMRSASLGAPGHVVLRLRYIPPQPTPKFLGEPQSPVVSRESAPRQTTGVQQTTLRRSLSVGREITFRSISVRLLRVDADGTATFIIRTPTTSFDTTIAKYHSEFVDDCEVYVEDVRPSGAPGSGRCIIQLRCMTP